ncbi:MAG: 50S ribosome-binding GTPase, partial [Acidobacteria bacterium]|nr:50S ribosome-binding GTPase [Acidobacteriota bacterium]
MSQPTVAILGRPNVGKSTLFNRICGQRRSLVGNEPGMTRDRVNARAEWGGRQFEIIDTGGMIPGDRDPMPGFIFEQAETAIRKSQVLVLVVDGRAGLTPLDQSLGKLLIECSKPVVVAVNKCDSAGQAIHASEFSELGLREVIPVSAAHGLNVGDLLDEVVKHLPRGGRSKRLPPGEIRVAIVGKPNVGKSTLLNRILGEDRSIVSPVPGTTRDAVDSRATRNGKVYRFMDTAG